MSKIRINYNLKNISDNDILCNNLIGIKNNNTIKYSNDNTITLVKILENMITIERKNKDYSIILPLKLNENTNGSYDLKNVGFIKLDIKTDYIIIKKNNLFCKYSVNEMQYEFQLEWDE